MTENCNYDLENLLLTKKNILLEWVNKSNYFSQIFHSFSQLCDKSVLSKMIKILIFEDYSDSKLSFETLLNKWKKSNLSENSFPLFLEGTSANEIIRNQDLLILLLEFLHSISFKISRYKKKKEIKKNRNSFDNENFYMYIENLEINEKIVDKILQWLVSIGLLRKELAEKAELKEKLPIICRNGVIFADIIERISGKKNELKGILRKPSNLSQINANFQKIFSHFRDQEKLNPRFLFTEKELMKGNPAIFWNFLDDLYYFYNKKQSPHDKRYKLNEKKNNHNIEENLQNQNDKKYGYSNSCLEHIFPSPLKQKPAPSPNEMKPSPHIIDKKINDSYLSSKNDAASDVTKSFTKKSQLNSSKKNSYRSINDDRKNVLSQENIYGKVSRSRVLSFYNILTPERKSRRNSLKNSASDHNLSPLLKKSPINKAKKNIISEELKSSVKIWLKSLGFRSNFLETNPGDILNDPVRTGVLLHKVMEIFGYEVRGSFEMKPKNIEDMRKNWSAIAHSMQKNEIFKNFSTDFLDIDEFIKGDLSKTYNILLHIKKLQSKETETFEINDFSSYTFEEIENLEKAMLYWIKFLGIPTHLNNFYREASSGILFCEIMKKLVKKQFFYIKNPRSENESLLNLSKAIECMKSTEIGQNYFSKVKEICQGNKSSILGLLEDLCRFSLGIPPREGVNFYVDGPLTIDVLEKKILNLKNGETILKNKSKNLVEPNQEIEGARQMYSFLC